MLICLRASFADRAEGGIELHSGPSHDGSRADEPVLPKDFRARCPPLAVMSVGRAPLSSFYHDSTEFRTGAAHIARSACAKLRRSRDGLQLLRSASRSGIPRTSSDYASTPAHVICVRRGVHGIRCWQRAMDRILYCTPTMSRTNSTSTVRHSGSSGAKSVRLA